MPATQPYLHPSQRNLKSQQVGPSSHTNEYHVGVLQGNWVEERRAIVQRPVDASLDCMTVSRASYQAPRSADVIKTKPVSQNEFPSNILFSSGARASDSATAARAALVEKKKANWAVENDPEVSPYQTTHRNAYKK